MSVQDDIRDLHTKIDKVKDDLSTVAQDVARQGSVGDAIKRLEPRLNRLYDAVTKVSTRLPIYKVKLLCGAL